MMPKVMNLVPASNNLPGRLGVELANNRQAVVLRIFEEINRNAIVMGISVEAQSAKRNAIESIDRIKEEWPQAHIDDICEAIKMGAFGQIKLDNQLHTMSASNIFNWYKEFRMNHQDKMKSPPPPPPEYKEFMITEDMKTAMIRKSFFRFISDPNESDHMIEPYYDKLITLGVLRPSDEVKTLAYHAEIFKLVNNVPMDFMYDKPKRLKCREFQNYYDGLEDKTKINFSMWAENPLHKRAILMAKRKMVIDFLKTTDKNAVMDAFDKYHENGKSA
jgi:hypothetical protein